ncbi:hypothetical protein Syun_002809 [Stephania yunnanensis]|uniref:Uncharacterized protein n=1 Tax=Stephania yunnanensis TaxID=152371 RepID=A0AAP0KZZ4_9MAGN
MDRILPFERTDSRRFRAGRWRDSHHGSREFVRWGSEDLRRPSVIVKVAVTDYLRRSPVGVCAFSCREEEREEESGFRPSRVTGGNGSIMPVAGVQPKGLSARETGEEATVRSKEANMIERTPNFGIKDEEPAFVRDEFASEPPSSQKRKGSTEYGFRKKEKKLKGDKKFDKGGKMSSKGGSLSSIYPGRDREMKELWDTVAEADSRMTKKVATELESLSIFCLAKRSLTIHKAEVLWVRGARREVARSEVDTARAILGETAYALPLQIREEILLTAIQTESRHGNKKESDIPMAKREDFVRGRKRFTNLSKLTCSKVADKYKDSISVKINVEHLVPYYGDTSDDDNSRANSVHPGENDEVQELACKFLIG